MSLDQTVAGTRPAATRRRGWAIGVVVVVVASLVATMTLAVLALVDTVPVLTAADQRDVAIGMPFAWLHQDQTSLEQPPPAQAGLISPLEHPTSVSAGMLALDVLLVLGVVLALLPALATARRAVRSR